MRNKYSARPLRCQAGTMHQSTSEARRCDELHLIQTGGLIRDLEAHPQVRSRNKEADGRRIERTEDGHWRIISHAKYRKIASKERAVERQAEYDERKRTAKKKAKGLCDEDGCADEASEVSLPKPVREARAPRPLKRRKTLGAKRRAAKAAGWVDPDSWQAVLAFYRYGCSYCSAEFWDQQDHCIPISRGGKHDISNVCPSCARCNAKKGTKTAYPKRRHPFMEKA